MGSVNNGDSISNINLDNSGMNQSQPVVGLSNIMNDTFDKKDQLFNETKNESDLNFMNETFLDQKEEDSTNGKSTMLIQK